MKLPSTLALLALLAFCATAHAANPTHCQGEPVPAIEAPFQVRCASDFGIQPDQGIDLTAKVQQALDTVAAQGAGLYFLAGDYRFDGNVLLRNRNTILGAADGVTRFIGQGPAARTMGDGTYGNTVSDLLVENIVFDNMTLGFYGRKWRNQVRYNAFVNTRARWDQLFISHYTYQVRGNVFMRGRDFPGMGLSTYRNVDTVIEGNFFGSPSNAARAAGYLDTRTLTLIARLQAMAARGTLALDGDQGHFVTGWGSTDGLKRSTFRRNFVAGVTDGALYNPATGQHDIGRDHAVYLKQYDDVDVVQNYFSGWPRNASGNVKFRNAQKLVFAANVLDHLSFDARPYDNSASLFMRGTLVFSNVFREGGISYWQNFTDTPDKFIEIDQFLAFNNTFHAADTSGCPVAGTWRNASGRFFSAGNRFAPRCTAARACDFEEISPAAMLARVPDAKRPLLTLKAISPTAPDPRGLAIR
ncbi:hypothetical protein [Mitsuaria sp. GD03876]|uniref:hypothetical protein n=1 Tax=Mitsuaria sp. GD03876 TaxID=2975399 RepID=UPI002449800B|nr:hypothetical protein [Mitsuaria sp. GD03876]MDH0867786.1 glycoside hydrolase family 55 protein [Mitsuaria sp. GD03876]